MSEDREAYKTKKPMSQSDLEQVVSPRVNNLLYDMANSLQMIKNFSALYLPETVQKKVDSKISLVMRDMKALRQAG